MNLADTLKMLARRWYIVLLGVLLAAGAVIGVWATVPPRFERTATQVLLPGKKSLPQDGQNPYLYLGGLTLAADVVVRAVGSDDVAREIDEQHPGTEIQVSRDPTTAGPVILMTVTSTRDQEAAAVLQQLTQRTALVLNDLQQEERIPVAERMTVVTLTIDTVGVVRDRTRLVIGGVAGLAVVALALLAAALTDGVARRRQRRRADGAPGVESASVPRRAADAGLTTTPRLGAGDEDEVDPSPADEPAEGNRTSSHSVDLEGPTSAPDAERTDGPAKDIPDLAADESSGADSALAMASADQPAASAAPNGSKRRTRSRRPVAAVEHETSA